MTEWIVARAGDSVVLVFGDVEWRLPPKEARHLGTKLLNTSWEIDEGDGSRVKLATPGAACDQWHQQVTAEGTVLIPAPEPATLYAALHSDEPREGVPTEVYARAPFLAPDKFRRLL